jgi:uncharacterized membrane protein YfcA
MPFNPPIPDHKPRGKARGVVNAIVQAEKMMQIALVLPCAAFIGWLAGAWIGARVHQPWLGALGVVFGGASGLYYVIRLAMHAVNDPANADKDSGSGKGNDGSD